MIDLTDIAAYLSTIDGPVLAGRIVGGAALLIMLIAIVGAWGPRPKTLDTLLAEHEADGRDLDGNVGFYDGRGVTR